jgi:putative nucleotidyltransferase with HDIG domain
VSATATPHPCRIVERIGELPTLPAIYARLAELTSSPDTSAEDLERVIEKDQALAGNLLKLVNSAFYGFPVEIRTISRAVMIVGFRALTQLALSASVLNMFRDDDHEDLDYPAFWAHAIGVAVTSRRLAMIRGGCPPEEAFLGGLLHDIGILVHARHLETEFSEFLGLARRRDLRVYEAEREVLGFDHADTGHALVTEWRLPKVLADAVFAHHEPSRALPVGEITAIVHVACVLCSGAGIGREGVDLVPPLDHAAWDAVGLSPARVSGLLEGVEAEIALFREMIGS